MATVSATKDEVRSGAYLHNGCRLIRIAGRLDDQVLVEDCRTLNVCLMRPGTLLKAGFKVIRRERSSGRA